MEVVPLTVNKERVLHGVLAYYFTDHLKRKRILNKFMAGASKNGKLVGDIKVLRTVLEEDAIDYISGNPSQYQLTRIKPILENFSNRMSLVRREVYEENRKRAREAEKQTKLFPVLILRLLCSWLGPGPRKRDFE